MKKKKKMDEKSVVWSWVLQALAMSDLVDLRLLYGLMDSAPPPLTLSRDASQAAAFRCLQALSASASEDAPNTHKHLHFPPSLTSQHLLHRVCDQTRHFQIDASQELLSSVHAFVNLNNPTLPTSNLELLKNIILQDNHPLLDDLRHHSGLHISPNSAETLQHQLHTSSPTPETNDPLPRVNISNGTSQHFENNTNGCYIDHHIHGIDTESHELHNLAPLGKKLKLQKQPQHSVSSDNKANETCGGDSSQKTVIGQPKTSTEIHDDLHQIGAILPDFQYEDPITLTDTEPNLCMKCNQGGQLLSCSSSTCPLFFHKNCMGGYVNFDDHGNFYCPICAYRSAVSDYVKAKDKMYLARKQLNLFIGGQSGNQPTHDHSRSLDNGVDQQRREDREKADDDV